MDRELLHLNPGSTHSSTDCCYLCSNGSGSVLGSGKSVHSRVRRQLNVLLILSVVTISLLFITYNKHNEDGRVPLNLLETHPQSSTSKNSKSKSSSSLSLKSYSSSQDLNTTGDLWRPTRIPRNQNQWDDDPKDDRILKQLDWIHRAGRDPQFLRKLKVGKCGNLNIKKCKNSCFFNI